MNELMITVAPGAPAALLDTYPDLPRTPEQIAQEVIHAWQAGACIAHLHVLDEKGFPTQDLAAFRRTIELIRAQSDILIEGSTGGLTGFDAPARCVALQTPIDMASLNTGSVNFGQGVYVNSPQDIAYWVNEMVQRRIKPSIAIFDTAMIENALVYVRQGKIAAPVAFNLVLGQTGAIPATARHLLFMVESLPPDSLWTVTGHGSHDLQAALWAVALGGHARVGYEDHIFYRPGERAPGNAALVERVVRIAREAGRPLASPDMARSLLGLESSTGYWHVHDGLRKGLHT